MGLLQGVRVLDLSRVLAGAESGLPSRADGEPQRFR